MQRNPSTRKANENTNPSATKKGPGRRAVHGDAGNKLAQKAAAKCLTKCHPGMNPDGTQSRKALARQRRRMAGL